MCTVTQSVQGWLTDCMCSLAENLATHDQRVCDVQVHKYDFHLHKSVECVVAVGLSGVLSLGLAVHTHNHAYTCIQGQANLIRC